MAEAKVQVDVTASGLEAAMANFQRFSGSASSVQRAMGQFGRMGEEALRSGGALTPEQHDKMAAALSNIKRIETDITKQVAERRAQTDAMMQQFPAMAKWIENIKKTGGTPLDAIRALSGQSEAVLKGMGMTTADYNKFSALLTPTKDDERAQRLRDAIPAAQDVFDKIGRANEDLPRKLEQTFGRFTQQFGRVLSMGMGVLGMGSALGILSQSRSRWLEFHIPTMEGGFLGGGAAGVRNLEAAAMGASGLAAGMPAEAAATGLALQRMGARNLDAEQIREFSRLGLFYGMGREGFANLGGEMGNTVFRGGDVNSVRRFGMVGAGISESAGLSQSQRMFFIESNRNLMEQTVRLYGGRPINVDDWYKGVNSLMGAFRPLNLAGGPMPLITETMRTLMPAFSPVGKSPTDNLRMALMMGFTPDDMMGTGKGLFGGAVQLLSNIGSGPGGVLGGLRTFLKGPLMAGADLGTGEGVTQALLMSNVVSPQMRDAITRLIAIPGGLEAFTGSKEVGDLPPDAAKALKALEDELAATEGGAWKLSDVTYVKDEIANIGGYVTNLESELKNLLGPQGALIASIVMTGLLGATLPGMALATTAAVGGGGYLLYEALKDPARRKELLFGSLAPGLRKELEEAPDDEVKMSILMRRRREAFAQGQSPDSAGNPLGLFDLPNRSAGIVEGRLIENMTASEALGYEMGKNREAVQELTKAINSYFPKQREPNATSNRSKGPTR